MTGVFQLALDTHAPVVTFGDAGNTTAGERLAVLYTINEPAIVSASIELADARVLAMDIEGDRLSVNLPPDAPDGWATVTAVARDVVHNEATYTTRVQISGTVVIPPEITPPTYPGRPALLEPFARRRSRTTVVTTSRTRIRAQLHDISTFGILDAGARIERSPIHSSTAFETDSQTRTRVRSRSGSRIRIGETTGIHKRPEGPGAEDELFLLGLL